MNAPRYDLASGRQSLLWSSRLWILAALLGALSGLHLVVVVHDNRAWRAASSSVAQATAEQHAERMNERLQLYAFETFAPVSAWRVDHELTGNAGLDALNRAQLAGERCKCRNVLPAAEFFRIDPEGNFVVRRSTEGAHAARIDISDSALSSIGQRDAERARSATPPRFRLTMAVPPKSYAVLTLAAWDSVNNTPVVYGLVANPHELLQALFGSLQIREVRSASGTATSTTDTQSLQVGHSDSVPLFGKLAPDRPYRAQVIMHGAMDGLGVSVALDARDMKFPEAELSQSRLWLLGFLLLCTVLVIVIAVGTSRREMFLARARSDFIAGTSHDLRMPLAQILLAGETLNLRAGASEEERTGLSTSIVRETRRLIGMVENVLLYSRSGAVEIKPTLHPVSVKELMDDVVASVQLAIDDANQSIAITADAELEVMADRHLLRQALVNLVENAVKYGRAAQCIQLCAASKGSLVQLWVDDEGPGIPESQRARVFEPYERLERDQASERAGSGLGLAVVYHIARICGGRAWIENAPGGGARVVIELSATRT